MCRRWYAKLGLEGVLEMLIEILCIVQFNLNSNNFIDLYSNSMVFLEDQDIDLSVQAKLGRCSEYVLHNYLLKLVNIATGKNRLRIHTHSLLYTIYNKYMPHITSQNFFNSFKL